MKKKVLGVLMLDRILWQHEDALEVLWLFDIERSRNAGIGQHHNCFCEPEAGSPSLWPFRCGFETISSEVVGLFTEKRTALTHGTFSNFHWRCLRRLLAPIASFTTSYILGATLECYRSDALLRKYEHIYNIRMEHTRCSEAFSYLVLNMASTLHVSSHPVQWVSAWNNPLFVHLV